MSDIAATIPPLAPTSNTDPGAVAAAIASPASPISTAPAPIPATVPVSFSAPVTAGQALLAKYAAAIFPALITLLTAGAVLPHAHTSIDLLQFGILLFSLVGAVFAKLSTVVTGWPGIIKTGILIIGALLSGALAFVQQNGDFSTFNLGSWLLFAAAVANAATHELGIQARTTTNAKTEENLLK